MSTILFPLKFLRVRMIGEFVITIFCFVIYFFYNYTSVPVAALHVILLIVFETLMKQRIWWNNRRVVSLLS